MRVERDGNLSIVKQVPVSDVSIRANCRDYLVVPAKQRIRGLRSRKIDPSPRNGICTGSNVAIHPGLTALPDF